MSFRSTFTGGLVAVVALVAFGLAEARAETPADFYKADDATSLQNAFLTIAPQLAALRLSK